MAYLDVYGDTYGSVKASSTDTATPPVVSSDSTATPTVSTSTVSGV